MIHFPSARNSLSSAPSNLRSVISTYVFGHHPAMAT